MEHRRTPDDTPHFMLRAAAGLAAALSAIEMPVARHGPFHPAEIVPGRSTRE